MTVALVAVLLLVAVIFWLARGSMIDVPADTAVVVERLGRYDRTLVAGRARVMPWLEGCAHRHSLAEQRVEISGLDCVSHDNVHVVVDAWVSFRVIDARKASYEIADLGAAVVSLARTAVREALGKVDVDRFYDERDVLSQRMAGVFGSAAAAWGIETLGTRIDSMRRGRQPGASA